MPPPVDTHRKLMFAGGILLVLALLADSVHQEEQDAGGAPGFNYAYAAGGGAIAALLASFYMFYSSSRGGRGG